MVEVLSFILITAGNLVLFKFSIQFCEFPSEYTSRASNLVYTNVKHKPMLSGFHRKQSHVQNFNRAAIKHSTHEWFYMERRKSTFY